MIAVFFRLPDYHHPVCAVCLWLWANFSKFQLWILWLYESTGTLRSIHPFVMKIGLYIVLMGAFQRILVRMPRPCPPFHESFGRAHMIIQRFVFFQSAQQLQLHTEYHSVFLGHRYWILILCWLIWMIFIMMRVGSPTDTETVSPWVSFGPLSLYLYRL